MPVANSRESPEVKVQVSKPAFKPAFNTVNKVVLPLLLALSLPALPALADIPEQDTLEEASSIANALDRPVALSDTASENFFDGVGADLDLAVLRALSARGIAAEGWRVETSLDRLGLRFDGADQPDPMRSGMTARSRIIDADGRVIDTVPVQLRARPDLAAVPEDAEVVLPTPETYYAALVSYYGNRVAEEVVAQN